MSRQFAVERQSFINQQLLCLFAAIYSQTFFRNCNSTNNEADLSTLLLRWPSFFLHQSLFKSHMSTSRQLNETDVLSNSKRERFQRARWDEFQTEHILSINDVLRNQRQQCEIECIESGVRDTVSNRGKGCVLPL